MVVRHPALVILVGLICWIVMIVTMVRIDVALPFLYQNTQVQMQTATVQQCAAACSRSSKFSHLKRNLYALLNYSFLSRGTQSISASGAWFLEPKGGEIAPGYPMAKLHVPADLGVAKILDHYIEDGQYVLDIGAGIGQYGHYFSRNRPNVIWEGLDGAINVENFTKYFVKYQDLTTPLWNSAYDAYHWVVCLEVGEHISKAYETQVFENVVSPALCGVILSWGLPGQGGSGHVNGRTNEYIISKMRSYGFEYERSSKMRRANATYGWFRRSLMVFLKLSAPSKHCISGPLALGLGPPRQSLRAP